MSMRLAALLLLDSSLALLAPPVSSAARGRRVVCCAAPGVDRLQPVHSERASQPLGRRAFTSAAAALLLLPVVAPSLAVADDCSYAALATLRSTLKYGAAACCRGDAGLRDQGRPPHSRRAPRPPLALWQPDVRPPSLCQGRSVCTCPTPRLPAVLTKVNNLATGDPKVAEAGLQAEALLANPARLSAAFDACAADEKSTKEAMKKRRGGVRRAVLAAAEPATRRLEAPSLAHGSPLGCRAVQSVGRLGPALPPRRLREGALPGRGPPVSSAYDLERPSLRSRAPQLAISSAQVHSDA